MPQTNTFQLIIAANGNRTFAIFLYLDDGINWTTGDGPSNGINGLGGTQAQVGYNAGDNINYYTVTCSMTDRIIDIETRSNVGIPGMYIFQINPNSTGKLHYTHVHTYIHTYIHTVHFTFTPKQNCSKWFVHCNLKIYIHGSF